MKASLYRLQPHCWICTSWSIKIWSTTMCSSSLKIMTSMINIQYIINISDIYERPNSNNTGIWSEGEPLQSQIRGKQQRKSIIRSQLFGKSEPATILIRKSDENFDRNRNPHWFLVQIRRSENLFPPYNLQDINSSHQTFNAKLIVACLQLKILKPFKLRGVTVIHFIVCIVSSFWATMLRLCMTTACFHASGLPM